MLHFIIPQDNQEIQKQIIALQYAIDHDTNEKDKQIHELSLKQIKNEGGHK